MSDLNVHIEKMNMRNLFGLLIGITLVLNACNAQEQKTTTMEKYNKLTPQEDRVLNHKATDMPFTGDYYQKKDNGIYICRQCNAHLYNSDDKFDSHCGWPSFDDEVEGAVKRVTDADGYRVEIICNNCQGHLGHVFEGEGFTEKNTRHCVNTSSILFIPADKLNEVPAKIVVK